MVNYQSTTTCCLSPWSLTVADKRGHSGLVSPRPLLPSDNDIAIEMRSCSSRSTSINFWKFENEKRQKISDIDVDLGIVEEITAFVE